MASLTMFWEVSRNSATTNVVLPEGGLSRKHCRFYEEGGWRLNGEPRVARFRVGKRRVLHRRHVRKYAEGELPPDRSFFFRGPTKSLNLRAANLARFVELADGVDEATWAHHLQQRDYSRWLRDQIKDPDLAGEVAAVEESGLPAAESRRQVLERVRQKYAV